MASYAIDTAMVFAAGFGKRMKPITDTLPKPLIKIAGKAMLDHCLDKLPEAGIEKAVVNSHYLADTLHSHIKMRKDRKPNIIISHEESILETGGGIVNALPDLGGKPVFIINGDIIWTDGNNNTLKRMVKAFDADKMDVLMLLCRLDNAIGYDGLGDFCLGEGGDIVKSDKANDYVYTGIMILNTEIMSSCVIKPFSVYKDFLQKKYMDKNGHHARMFGMVHDGGWLHIGTADGIRQAENYFCDQQSA